MTTDEQDRGGQPSANRNDVAAIPYHSAYFGCCNRTVMTRQDIAQPAFCPFCGKLLATAGVTVEPSGDVFDFVGRKMATHLVETMNALEGFDEPFRGAGQEALEEFWFRATGHHIDWDSLAPEMRAEDLTKSLSGKIVEPSALQALQEEAWARWRAFGGERDARTNSDAMVAAAYGWIAQELAALSAERDAIKPHF